MEGDCTVKGSNEGLVTIIEQHKSYKKKFSSISVARK